MATTLWMRSLFGRSPCRLQAIGMMSCSQLSHARKGWMATTQLSMGARGRSRPEKPSMNRLLELSDLTTQRSVGGHHLVMVKSKYRSTSSDRRRMPSTSLSTSSRSRKRRSSSDLLSQNQTELVVVHPRRRHLHPLLTTPRHWRMAKYKPFSHPSRSWRWTTTKGRVVASVSLCEVTFWSRFAFLTAFIRSVLVLIMQRELLRFLYHACCTCLSYLITWDVLFSGFSVRSPSRVVALLAWPSHTWPSILTIPLTLTCCVGLRRADAF